MNNSKPRSSYAALGVVLLLLVGGGITAALYGYSKQESARSELKQVRNNKVALESAQRELIGNLDTTKKKYSLAKSFIERVDTQRQISHDLEIGTATAKRRIEKIMLTNKLTPGAFEPLKDIEFYVGKSRYIGRKYRFEGRGTYRDIGKAMAMLENTIPLLRMDSLSIKPDEDTMNEQLAAVFSVTIISTSGDEVKKGGKK